MIEYLPPVALDEAILRAHIYPRTEQTLFWSDSWDPAYYVAAARAGFISISVVHPEHGPILIPELQENYAILDWENLHRSRNLARIMRSGRMEEEELELRVANPCEHVLSEIMAYHGRSSWLHKPYLALMRELSNLSCTAFSLHGIELWSRKRAALIAGELGYSIGATYTSLSGFCSRSERRWRSFGTLQQYLFARVLEKRGYHFWNMGHVGMAYKHALGAEVVPREAFLERWIEARAEAPSTAFANGDVLKRYVAHRERESPG